MKSSTLFHDAVGRAQGSDSQAKALGLAWLCFLTEWCYTGHYTGLAFIVFLCKMRLVLQGGSEAQMASTFPFMMLKIFWVKAEYSYPKVTDCCFSLLTTKSLRDLGSPSMEAQWVGTVPHLCSHVFPSVPHKTQLMWVSLSRWPPS